MSRPNDNAEFTQQIRILELQLQIKNREIQKLMGENSELKKRVIDLQSDDDKRRIKHLVADGIRKQLSQLKVLTRRGMDSLQHVTNSFNSFLDEIDDDVKKTVEDGAIELAAPLINRNPSLTIEKFEPELSKIIESPAISNTTLTPETPENVVPEGAKKSISNLIVSGSEDMSFAIHTPAARPSSRRRRALTNENFSIGNETDVVEDSFVDTGSTQSTTLDSTLVADSNNTLVEDADSRKLANKPGRPRKVGGKKAAPGPSTSSNESSSVANIYDFERTHSITPSNASISSNLSSGPASRPRRTAARNIRTFKEPSLSKKLRRDN